MKHLAVISKVLMEGLLKQAAAVLLILVGLIMWIACASADQVLDGLAHPPGCYPGRPTHPVSL